MNLTLKSFFPPIDFGWNYVRARCGNPDCHNKLLTRSVPQNRAGIWMGSDWYCGADCFVVAARTRLAALATERVTEMPRNPRLSVGLAMLSRGYLTEEQLRIATEQSRLHGEPLEASLVRLGLAGEKQLAAARAAQWGYPILGHDVSGLWVQVDLPRTLLLSFSAAPLHYVRASGRLVLGFVQRVEHSLLQAIELMAGCRAEPCFLTPTEFEEQLARIAILPEYEEIVVEEPETPAQMARTLGGLAMDVAAGEARFVHCKSWIWARLAGGRRSVDVLFGKKSAASLRNGGLASLQREGVVHLA